MIQGFRPQDSTYPGGGVGAVSRATDPTQSSGVGLGGEKHLGRKEVWRYVGPATYDC